MVYMTSYYRIQTADRDVTELLDAGHQFSSALSHDPSLTRQGVSVCDSIDDLALYLASHLGAGIGQRVRTGSWVIVEVEGEPVPGALDPEFETLVRPTAIVSVRPVGDEFLALIDAKDEFLAGFDDTNLWED